MFKKIKLKNGLRLILVPQENTQAVTVLVLVGTGSKYETKQNNGISHFLEHMFFKGTKKRPTAKKITETLDKVGGIYNAFTSKEYTGYFAKMAKDKLNLALDWVSDILLNSKFEPKEIEREKGVILQEINMYLDTPSQYIEDLWEELLYGEQPAGWKILGNEKNILRFKRKDLLSYLQNHYSAENTVLCIAGSFNSNNIEADVKKYFAPLKATKTKDKPKVKELQKNPKVLCFYKETDQTHLCLGVRGFNLFEKERYTQMILATALGGNMSSRLFSIVREKHALAYYISTTSQCYTDSGYLVTQAGVPHKSLKKAITLITKEYKKVREKGLSNSEIKKAKEYIKGTTILGLESSEAKASFFATQELLKNKIITPEEKLAEIDKVSPKEIKRTAQHIFQPQNLNLALIGPHKNEKDLEEFLKAKI